MANLVAPKVQQQAVSVTRKMSASLPGLREIAAQRGLKVHHLGAGYPHPEVTDLTTGDPGSVSLARTPRTASSLNLARALSPSAVYIYLHGSRGAGVL